MRHLRRPMTRKRAPPGSLGGERQTLPRSSRWLRTLRVLGCSGPSTRSKIVSARSKAALAPAKSP